MKPDKTYNITLMIDIETYPHKNAEFFACWNFESLCYQKFRKRGIRIYNLVPITRLIDNKIKFELTVPIQNIPNESDAEKVISDLVDSYLNIEQENKTIKSYKVKTNDIIEITDEQYVDWNSFKN
jgi:hypothetical protein